VDRTIPSERPKRGFISDTVCGCVDGSAVTVPDIKAQEMTTNSKKMTWMPAMQIHGTSNNGISWKKLHALCRSCCRILSCCYVVGFMISRDTSISNTGRHASGCTPRGLVNYIDTKAKCRHLKIVTCKVTLWQVFIRVYRLVIQPIMLVFFRPSIVDCLPL
jgi:hypothetical protein